MLPKILAVTAFNGVKKNISKKSKNGIDLQDYLSLRLKPVAETLCQTKQGGSRNGNDKNPVHDTIYGL